MAGVENANSSAAAAAVAVSSPVTRTGSPWTQILRGAGSDSGIPSSLLAAAAAAENRSPGVETADDNAGNKKPAWSKTPASENGAVVMEAEQWPPLSESTKASPKLSPSNSSKSLSDSGSVPTSQKPTTSNANHNSTANHGRPTRQKSMRRDGGGNAQANGGFSHHPAHNHNHNHYHNNHNTSVKTGSAGGSEISGRDNNQNHSYRESGPRNPSGVQPHPRNSLRRGNGGTHPWGDGSHHNYGGRRGDQDRGNHDWSHQRYFNGGDGPWHTRPDPRGFLRPSPFPVPYFYPGGPAPIQPPMNPMVMPDLPIVYHDPYGMQLIAPVHPTMYSTIPLPDPMAETYSKQKEIAHQIDYYFSNENLVKDPRLRQIMDKDGWVPIETIAGFPKMKEMTDNIKLILDAVQTFCTGVELKGDKVRKRDDYLRWILSPNVQIQIGFSTPSPRSTNVDGKSI